MSPVLFQSTRPMRGATGGQCIHQVDGNISIHAPHAGRDKLKGKPRSSNPYFNPRAPCGARRHSLQATRFPQLVFQSTRPMRGATFMQAMIGRWSAISIHAPHAGRDVLNRLVSDGQLAFQSTRPMRGATLTIDGATFARKISIHAPHAGRDRASGPSCLWWANFNPRAPCGARQ